MLQPELKLSLLFSFWLLLGIFIRIHRPQWKPIAPSSSSRFALKQAQMLNFHKFKSVHVVNYSLSFAGISLFENTSSTIPYPLASEAVIQ